jgi:hypothetical protein
MNGRAKRFLGNGPVKGQKKPVEDGEGVYALSRVFLAIDKDVEP